MCIPPPSPRRLVDKLYIGREKGLELQGAIAAAQHYQVCGCIGCLVCVGGKGEYRGLVAVVLGAHRK